MIVREHEPFIICDSWPQPALQESPWDQQPEDMPTVREDTDQGGALRGRVE